MVEGTGSGLKDRLIVESDPILDNFRHLFDTLRISYENIIERQQIWNNLYEDFDKIKLFGNYNANEEIISKSFVFKEETGKLKQEISALMNKIQELEQMVIRVETNRNNFKSISDQLLQSKKLQLYESKKQILLIKQKITSSSVNQIMAKLQNISSATVISQPKTFNSKFDTMMSQGNFQNSDTVNNFNNEHMLIQQQELRKQQDVHLDDLEKSATRLGEMAGNIGGEIGEQNVMLDEFGNDINTVQGRMEDALKRMDVLLKTNNRCQTFTILILILVALVMFFLVASSL